MRVNLSMKYVILYVTDFEKSLNFYRDQLGLKVKMQQGTYVEFHTGATTLSINTRESVQELIGLDMPETDAPQSFEVGFTVENVESTIEKLRSAGVPVVKEPTVKPWGQTVAYVTDPDGHYIEICTAM